MKICWVAVIFGLFFSGQAVAQDSEMQAAAALLAPLKQSLFTALSTALPTGTENALQVCHLDAQQLTLEAQPVAAVIGRTSNLLRNPDNAPPPWVEPALADYLESPVVEPRMVELAGGGRGYVEPIFMAEVCTQCHGVSIAPSVAARLAQLYPQDEATGYLAGDFRGLFWVELAAPD